LKFNNVFLALGSNLNNRKDYLERAIMALTASAQVEVMQQSTIYETAPKYRTDQPYFLNQVIKVETDLSPIRLLKLCKEIEKKLGRNLEAPRFSPREIDIDILAFGEEIIDIQDLKVPHMLMHERRFVLEPLSEIAHEYRCPRYGKAIGELLGECRDTDDVMKLDEEQKIL